MSNGKDMIGFDLLGIFCHPDAENGKNVIILGVDMTNSKHANNKTKEVLVLGHGLIQKVDDTTIYAEKCIRLILLLPIKQFA